MYHGVNFFFWGGISFYYGHVYYRIYFVVGGDHFGIVIGVAITITGAVDGRQFVEWLYSLTVLYI